MLVAALLALPLAHAAPLLSGLQVEGLIAPLAISAAAPRFSWLTGAQQSSYRLQLSQTFPAAALLWDTGAVASNASHLIPYAGAPLPADADFSLTLTATLQGIGGVSASTAFSTAPAAPLPGAWLGLADTLRGTLSLSPEPITRARLHATGVGCYAAYVNGERISPPLAPGFGHAPSARALFNTYDVARLLGPGENALGLRLGSCKWGAFGQYCTRGSAALCNAGWALLSVTQGSNTSLLATGAGGGWVGANTSVLQQHLWNGELFDARAEAQGWARPGFAPATPWPSAQAADTEDLIGPLLPAPAPPVDRGEVVLPASVTPLAAPGTFVFDLGVNIAGTCGLDLAPPPGEAAVGAGLALSLLHGELLQLSGNGSVYNHYLPPGGTHQPNGLNQPQMNYTYITRGGGGGAAAGGELMGTGPHFSYFGFRYIELRGWPYAAAPALQRLSCHFLHTELAPSGAVAFPGTPLLDALQASTLRTHLANLVTLPTDCPQREKRGWTGDAQLTIHSTLLNFDALAFYEAWHESILDQQRIGCLPKGSAPGRSPLGIRPPNWACDPPAAVPNITLAQYQFGPVSDVVPREQLGMGYFIGDPSWEVAATTIPYELLTATGNLARLAATFDGPQSLLRWFNALGQASADSAGLIPWSYLGDWVAIDTPNNKLVANANYALAAQQGAEMAAALGRTAEAATYAALAALLSDAVRARFWNASALHWDAGSQSAQALCLALGLGGEAVAAPAAAALLGAVQAAGGRLTVGASGAQVLLRVLHSLDPGAALALALQTATPSWGAFVTPNASAAPVPTPGTMWESWLFKDVAGGSSLNHIFKAGGISPYLYEGALGLSFAMRPGTGDAAAAASSSSSRGGCACEAELGLPWSPSARLGLPCTAVAALCSVVQGVRANSASSPGTELGALREAVAAALQRAGVPEQRAGVAAAAARLPPLVARVGFAVTLAAAQALGQAAGWRNTPAGRIALSWAYRNASLSVNLTAPAGSSAESVLELPLGQVSGEGAAALVLGVPGGSVRVPARAGGGVALGAVEGSAGTWHPALLQCGAGAAAAHVAGARALPAGAVCQPVLLLRVPAGEHALVLAAE